MSRFQCHSCRVQIKPSQKLSWQEFPVFGLLYKRGSVLVDRKNEESRKMSYIKMKEVLDMGLHMCIYPEGTRNKTSQPCNAFMTGLSGFHLIQENQFCPLSFLTVKKFYHENFSFSGRRKLNCII